jgi:hypothetical protein
MTKFVKKNHEHLSQHMCEINIVISSDTMYNTVNSF